ncbi:hypothetical protein DCAR_0727252 [Daucus carota subsp. sativus]|uniref:Uncharacterized protein n=1 Tax=Daucus carota subsp. sativus TaxID=79200 RepID=A0AAF0XGV3_DAUCS|nr:hypothetical protein DCAR_0727252 [Daucus carota subsp. sativus]
MDSFVVPLSPSNRNAKPQRRPRWRRLLVELNGKSDPRYRRDLTSLLIKSYYETGVFAHSYRIDGEPCPTHVCGLHGVSCLELDSKGIYLASATKLGCLSVHDFDTLYCQEDETKHVLHINTGHQIDVVRWNIANQDEVACTSMRSSEVYIFDIGYMSSEPVKVLRKRPSVSIHGSGVHKGLSDVAFTSRDDSRYKFNVLIKIFCASNICWVIKFYYVFMVFPLDTLSGCLLFSYNIYEVSIDATCIQCNTFYNKLR